MFKSPLIIIYLALVLSLSLTGCSSRLPNTTTPPQQSIQQRNQQMLHLNTWSIKGKIAFIEQLATKKTKRQSASLRWEFSKQPLKQNRQQSDKQNTKSSQKIDLTTFLGINVLHVESSNDEHTLKVDGKTYHGKNLSQMIEQLTGLLLPTKALSYWLKGIPFDQKEQITYNNENNLPEKLITSQWQVLYGNYKNFSGYMLATKITVLHDNLRIKIAINKWSNL
ncbi:MAG: outer membrane lipoprotein LolB [Gammaproteobacteria bacterium]|nr:MAG: outer membrane lipoprotein LolB [Gammaproteobacteria bacterium]